MEPVKVSQVLDGVIELITQESLDTLACRLETGVLKETISVTRVGANGENDPCLDIVGPYGNRFLVYRVSEELANTIQAVGSHSGGSSSMLGIKNVRIYVPRGTTGIIAAFYKYVFECKVAKQSETCCAVTFDFVFEQKLIFEEKEGIPCDLYDTLEKAGYHIAIYLSSRTAFEHAFKRAHSKTLVYINPRFEGGPEMFASTDNLKDAIRVQQFRLKDIRSSESSKLAYQLEHEVRGPGHVRFPINEHGISSL
mmetsp:Transcript_11207/g.17854  ORF Transcript_11207/g.17854 Transcript_11207/m.17854 type:complete len:253 (+) Transcript_11207:88-846(+)